MSRVLSLNENLKRFDSKLFVKKESSGAIHLYRHSSLGSHSPANYIMALTHDWTADGRSVEWGIEVILARLKAMDLWRDNRTMVDELLESYEKNKASERRAFRNNVEAFLYDFRRDFAKATNDINTSCLAKTDKRRMGDKRLCR